MNSRLGSLVSGCEGTTAVTNPSMSWSDEAEARSVKSTHLPWSMSPASPLHMLRLNAYNVAVFRGGPF